MNFLDRYSKKKKTPNIKIRPAGTELFDTDVRTNMTKLKVAIRNFANAKKMQQTGISEAITAVNINITARLVNILQVSKKYTACIFENFKPPFVSTLEQHAGRNQCYLHEGTGEAENLGSSIFLSVNQYTDYRPPHFHFDLKTTWPQNSRNCCSVRTALSAANYNQYDALSRKSRRRISAVQGSIHGPETGYSRRYASWLSMTSLDNYCKSFHHRLCTQKL